MDSHPCKEGKGMDYTALSCSDKASADQDGRLLPMEEQHDTTEINSGEIPRNHAVHRTERAMQPLHSSKRAAAYALADDDVDGYNCEEDILEAYPGDEDDVKHYHGTDINRGQHSRSSSRGPGAYNETLEQGPTLRPSFRLSNRTAHNTLSSASSEESKDNETIEHQGITHTTTHAPVAEATPVDENMGPQAVAIPVEQRGRNKLSSNTPILFQIRPLFFFLTVLLSLLAGTLVGFVLGRQTTNNPNYAHVPTQPPTTATITSLATPPTLAPVDHLDTLLQHLPSYTLDALQDSATPQWQAYYWLSEHPELPSMPDWRKRQLFVMGTFFYAMEGPKWRRYIRERWLQYTDECFWFNSEFGDFVGEGENEKWVPDPVRQATDPCNERGEIQSICVAQLGIVDEDPSVFPHVPREIALLTSLTLLGPCENEMVGDFKKIFPTELYSMGNLTRFNMINNQLTGKIPSELGLLTKLTFLNLQENMLTGSLPSELMRLTNLKELYLHDNFLTGTLAAGLGRMDDIRILHLFNNSFSGTIPEELGHATSLEQLLLHSNKLTGTIPQFRSDRLTTLNLGRNELSGIIPEGLCLLGHYNRNEENATGLNFDCTRVLCGCDGCDCSTVIKPQVEAPFP